MDYNTLIFIHIASVILLLGVGGGSAFYKFMADKSRDLTVIMHTNKMIVLADWLFTTPSAIVQPVTGILLMNLTGISWNTPWLLTSLILYIFAGLLWLVAVYLQIKMRNLAIEAHSQNRFVGKEYFILVNYWIWLGVFSFLAMGAVFYLMIFKL